MNILSSVPVQRQDSVGIRLLRKALKTQLGKHIAFQVGLRGFNRKLEEHFSFVRELVAGEVAPKGFVVFTHDTNPTVPEGARWLYSLPRIGFTYNSRVDKGAALQASLQSGSSLGSISSPLAHKYIALSPTSLTPAKGDTTLSGETAAAGLARVLGTVQNYVAPSTLDGAASFDIYNQFTNTSGGSVTINSSALFDAASTGNMFAEANLSAAATMNNNDILQLTWTVNI